jgi:hypothetical protein
MQLNNLPDDELSGSSLASLANVASASSPNLLATEHFDVGRYFQKVNSRSSLDDPPQAPDLALVFNREMPLISESHLLRNSIFSKDGGHLPLETLGQEGVDQFDPEMGSELARVLQQEQKKHLEYASILQRYNNRTNPSPYKESVMKKYTNMTRSVISKENMKARINNIGSRHIKTTEELEKESRKKINLRTKIALMGNRDNYDSLRHIDSPYTPRRGTSSALDDLMKEVENYKEQDISPSSRSNKKEGRYGWNPSAAIAQNVDPWEKEYISTYSPSKGSNIAAKADERMPRSILATAKLLDTGIDARIAKSLTSSYLNTVTLSKRLQSDEEEDDRKQDLSPSKNALLQYHNYRPGIGYDYDIDTDPLHSPSPAWTQMNASTRPEFNSRFDDPTDSVEDVVAKVEKALGLSPVKKDSPSRSKKEKEKEAPLEIVTHMDDPIDTSIKLNFGDQEEKTMEYREKRLEELKAQRTTLKDVVSKDLEIQALEVVKSTQTLLENSPSKDLQQLSSNSSISTGKQSSTPGVSPKKRKGGKKRNPLGVTEEERSILHQKMLKQVELFVKQANKKERGKQRLSPRKENVKSPRGIM